MHEHESETNADVDKDVGTEFNTQTEESSQAQAPQLSSIELRVLGVLMEKQLTTPDLYPLTLNSVITACNQKSSREPVSNYTQGEVARVLQQLDDKNFVRKERSSRSEKFSQQFMHHLELGRKQQALLCVMMLRGPQSVSELNTRTQRMCEFNDKEELDHCIERLCHREIPYAIRLGHQPGQRGERIGHLFSGTPVSTSTSNPSTKLSGNTPNSVQQTANPSEQTEMIQLLESEVESLAKTITTLKKEASNMRLQLAQLYVLTGHKMDVATPDDTQINNGQTDTR